MKPWTTEEEQKLKELYPNLPNREIGRRLGRTVIAVRSKANVMGIKKAPDFNRMAHAKSTVSETTKTFIRDNYHKYSNYELADMAGVSKSSVQMVRKQYGLEKPNCGCFNPGHTPFNKGLSQDEYMSEKSIKKSAKTRFKKGNKPANTKWDGALSIRHQKNDKTSYMYIRLAKAKWVPYHRYQWEKKNGPIPEGMILRSRDGDTLNCHPDNWELISRAEHAYRNQNREKAAKTITKHWAANGHPATNLEDTYVAGLLAGGDKELREYLIEHRQDLIRVARKNYKLKRKIREYEK